MLCKYSNIRDVSLVGGEEGREHVVMCLSRLWKIAVSE